MEEPKRRARRVPQPLADDRTEPEVQPALHTPAGNVDAVPHTDAPQHRRRVQQAMDASAESQEKTQAEPETQVQLPVEPKTPKLQKKKAQVRRALSQTVLGAIVVLGIAGKAAAAAARKIKREHLRLLAMTVCVFVAVYSAWQIGGIVLRSVRTNRLNESLSQQRAAIIEAQQETNAQLTVFAPTQEPTAVPTAQPTAMPETEPVQESAAQTEEKPAQAVATPKADAVKTTKYRQVGGDALPEMAQMHQQNHDLVAWLQIPDVLDLPVVYRDNSYYLTRDFAKQKNASGTIFLDENHPFKEKTQNLLLHGHNMKDGTMFGRLAQYLYDDTYLRNHPIIYFDTLWKKEQYVIVAVLDVSLKPGDKRFFNYFTHDTFSSDIEFEMYIRQLQLRSQYAIPIDVQPTDALLTLSTCLDEDRLVIVCRRLRENETRSELRTLIRMSTRQ